MIFYTNQAGQSFPLRERALEPPDCWAEEPDPLPACQCSKCEQDIWPGEYTFGDGMGGELCRECFESLLRSEYKTRDIAEALGFDVTLQ